jgi:hypothetical protein
MEIKSEHPTELTPADLAKLNALRERFKGDFATIGDCEAATALLAKYNYKAPCRSSSWTSPTGYARCSLLTPSWPKRFASSSTRTRRKVGLSPRLFTQTQRPLVAFASLQRRAETYPQVRVWEGDFGLHPSAAHKHRSAVQD